MALLMVEGTGHEGSQGAMYGLLIADDDSSELGRLEVAVKCVPEMSVIAKATSGAELRRLMRQTSPDVALVDIEMFGRSGTEIGAALPTNDDGPIIICVGASDQLALRAFEIGALDYIVKPVQFERLRHALRRAQNRLHSRATDARFAELESQLSALAACGGKYRHEVWVKERRGLTRVPTADIDLLEASGDYVIAHVGQTTHLVTENISSLEAKLDPDELLRIHRGSIVNLKRVRNLVHRGRRGLAVSLANGMQKPIGPTYCDTVLRVLDARRWR